MFVDIEQSDSPSPFHRGEQEVQQRFGVKAQIEQFGRRVIRDHMPEQHREFYQQLPFILVGHADKSGWPWASILYNEPGFISSNDDKILEVEAVPVVGDPLEEALHEGSRLGVLGIELPSRRRNRLAAHIVESTIGRFKLSVDQAFGNCPQYIQSRELEHIDMDDMPAAQVEDIVELDEWASGLIRNSDTFFVASHVENASAEASEGADVSHRGGKPGFVRIDNKVTLTIPDYKGNNHFNTLGNFVENGKAGLLFLDFENGHLLTLTGTVEIRWDDPETEFFEGAERLWTFRISHGRKISNGLALRWKLLDYSPNTLLTGTWDKAEKLRHTENQRRQWLPYSIEKIVDESSVIKSFYLKPGQGLEIPKFKPGQFLTVKAEIEGRETIRTYTVSSAPADRMIRISVKREYSADGNSPDGVFSNYIHDKLKEGDVIFAKAPCGSFVFDGADSRPAVLLAGGVGITPMISMARHALIEGLRTRYTRPITVISAASNAGERAFFSELNDIAMQSSGRIRSFWSLSEIDSTLQEGVDYHHSGRISGQMLQAVLPLDDYDFFLCGPGSFMQSMYNMLRDLGVADGRIMAEAFGPAALQRRLDSVNEASLTLTAANQAVVEFTDSGVEQAWSHGDGSLLEFAEVHGFAPEFGCRSGHCGACKTKLVAGKVSYQTEPSTGRQEDEVLLCCAVPASVEGEDVVRISIAL